MYFTRNQLSLTDFWDGENSPGLKSYQTFEFIKLRSSRESWVISGREKVEFEKLYNRFKLALTILAQELSDLPLSKYSVIASFINDKIHKCLSITFESHKGLQ